LYVCLIEDGSGEPPFLFQQSEKQVFDVNLLVSMANGDGLCRAEGLLQLFGESIEVHEYRLRS
jgi:hypothetical protein